MTQKIKDLIFKISNITEILVSIIITISILMMIVSLAKGLIADPGMVLEIERFNEFLGIALGLVVGVEFVNLLCKHTAEMLIEVLMFATARQIVVEHLSTVETLVGIVAIMALFAVRKYLLLDEKHAELKQDEL